MQPPQNISDIITLMTQQIVDHFHPEKIILFGSYARGGAGPDSDVDFLVILRSVVSRRKKAMDIYRVLAGMGLPKDVIVATTDEMETYKDIPGTLIFPALREGKVLYEQPA